MNWKHHSKIGASMIMLVIVLQYLFASTAFAEFGFAPPAATDLSRSFLNQIFGGLLDGGVDAFGESIKSFNGAILVVGGILAAYTIFAGTLGTAHDGEMLGKKFSSVWIPIRYALGTALVLPILTGGYCVMQAIVMWLIMQGVSIANGIWSEYMSNPPALQTIANATPSRELISFVEQLYMIQVCVAGNNFVNGGGNPSGAYFGTPHTFGSQVKTNMKVSQSNLIDPRAGQFIQFGSTHSRHASHLNCGKVFYPYQKQSLMFHNTNDSGMNNSNISNQGENNNFSVPSAGSIKSIFQSPNYDPAAVAHYDALDNIVVSTKALAETYVGVENTEDVPDNAYDSIMTIAESYTNAIRGTVTSVVTEANKNLANAATEQGWFLAGAWATQIIINQNKLNAIINAVPSVEEFTFGVKSSNRASDKYAKAVVPALSVISASNATASAFINKTGISNQEANEEPQTISTGGKFATFISKFLTGLDLEAVREDKRHPLIIMSTIGNNILNTVILATSAIFVLAGIAAAAGMLKVDATPAFITFYGTFAIPIAAFMGIAATLAYLLPNMPFLLWIGIIIGWTVMCVEAILAAPLWAVMHLHPNGDDLTGRGGNGYMLVLGLLLRPALIIFGLIAAIILSGMFGSLINIIFLDTFALNQGDGGLGFFAVLFGTGLYAAMMMTVIKQTFNLMHVIPDQLLRWVGGGQEQLGQYAGASVDSMTKASAIGGAAVGLATKDLAQSAGGIAREIGRKAEGEKAKEANIASERNQAEMNVGSGAGEAFKSIDDANGGTGKGGNSFGATQQKNEMTSIAKSLGGNNSAATSSFFDKFNSERSSGASVSDAKNTALSHALDTHFGQGGGDTSVSNAVKQLSGGTPASSNGAGGFGSANETARTVSKMQNIISRLDNKPGSTHQGSIEALGQMIDKTNNDSSVTGAAGQDGASISAYREAFSKHSDV